jgi:hypothetical protein
MSGRAASMAGTLAKNPPPCPRYATPRPFMHTKSDERTNGLRAPTRQCLLIVMLTEVPAADTPMLLPLDGLCALLLAMAPLNDPVAVTVPLFEALIDETLIESLVGTPGSMPSLRI